MSQARYQIFQLSARAVMSYAVETADGYSFDLSALATEKCKSRTATHEQDSNALFFQILFNRILQRDTAMIRSQCNHSSASLCKRCFNSRSAWGGRR